MKTGIFKTSYKENEKRVPICPEHIQSLSNKVLRQLVFEEGYGEDWGYSDSTLSEWGCNIATRSALFNCDIIILPKPVASDLEQMKEGGIICGWTHAVQQRDITDLAIQKGLTLIAWEEMNIVSNNSKIHLFYRNNELAGYAGVIHYLQLKGLDGHYGSPKKVVVIGYGSVSRGAIYALQGRGFHDIIVYTNRLPHNVGDKNINVQYKCLNNSQTFKADLQEADIIVNGVLQDVNSPRMFIESRAELMNMKENVGIIDISCDKGMGFYFAEPTSFESPIIDLPHGASYYSVDHTPTYLWHAASKEISDALLPYLSTIIDPTSWETQPVVFNAIDIMYGEIMNSKIKTFQKRD